MLSAIIVEDMPQAIEVLKSDLATYCPNVQVIGTANSIVNAAKMLRQNAPDLIFLDILLGDGTGFDLLEIFPNLTSKIIFVTASDEFAIRAFRIAAIDYLLKPIDPNQLIEAVKKTEIQVEGARESLHLLKETIKKPDTLPTRISLTSADKISVVNIEEIIRCESDGNNTWFIMDNGEKIFVSRTMKQFEQILENHAFMRVQQSHLIHLKYLQEFIKKEGGYIKMKNGDMIPISSRKRQEIMDYFETM
jgi:two-component system, LytTR family, response regulator